MLRLEIWCQKRQFANCVTTTAHHFHYNNHYHYHYNLYYHYPYKFYYHYNFYYHYHYNFYYHYRPTTTTTSLFSFFADFPS